MKCLLTSWVKCGLEINKKNCLFYIEKKHFLSVFKYEFLLCSKLNKSYGGRTLLVGFLMLLYGYLYYKIYSMYIYV
jgi:hypothetical protein